MDDKLMAGASTTGGSRADEVILGIHSYIDENTQQHGNFTQRLTDRHARLTVMRNGKTEYYGLWPDDHPTRKHRQRAGQRYPRRPQERHHSHRQPLLPTRRRAGEAA